MARMLRGTSGLGGVLGLGALVALASCAPPPPPPPTVVNLTITASKDVNPTASGQGAPVQIVVYQLASSAGFSGAEFFQIFHSDAATLGSDLIKKDTFNLAPGASKTTTLMPMDPAKELGVFAAYQNYQSSTWRATTPIPPHVTTNVTITAGHDGVTVTAAPAPASKPGS